ncbi:hypothetical protein ACHAPZ_011595 [Fusarium culmorum]|uniref:Uncharacterized protein n=1 Tax=Fusarium culmorum TaxID=5516 RepID=A0A2T4GRM6_FUSCU|nr:hypothetical protein FCULG_00012260 [Fusarium culmorum]
MYLNIITSLVLLGSIATAAPTSDQSLNLQKRATRPDVAVEIFTDQYCEDSTGTFIDNKPKCINLDNFSVDILAINAEVDGTILGDRCSWEVWAYPNLDCDSDDNSSGAGKLSPYGTCRHLTGLPTKPIKSVGVYEFGPCE